MSVNIANTTAGISGKTVELAESDQTITGLKTFDRDPSAPFAVSANSAVVSNLDADKLDGQEGSYYLNVAANHVAAWTSYTPTWGNLGTANTLGDATLTGAYVQIGKLVFFKIDFTFGSTSSVGNAQMTFTLPGTASGATGVVGAGYIVDSGTTRYGLIAPIESTTTIRPMSSDASNTGLTSTTPITWATGDEIHIIGMYQAA